MTTITITGADAGVARTLAGAAAMNSAAMESVGAAAEKIAAKIRENLSGAVLQQRTGKLASSIVTVEPSEAAGVVSGGVDVGAGVPYGVFQEKGGTRSYSIVPVQARALHFVWEGQEWFRQRVTRKPLPQRSFAASAADALSAEITADVEARIRAAVTA